MSGLPVDCTGVAASLGGSPFFFFFFFFLGDFLFLLSVLGRKTHRPSCQSIQHPRLASVPVSVSVFTDVTRPGFKIWELIRRWDGDARRGGAVADPGGTTGAPGA